MLTISLGYFLYDTAVCFILDNDPWNAAHHLCTILGLLVGVCNRMVSCCIISTLAVVVVANIGYQFSLPASCSD